MSIKCIYSLKYVIDDPRLVNNDEYVKKLISLLLHDRFSSFFRWKYSATRFKRLNSYLLYYAWQLGQCMRQSVIVNVDCVFWRCFFTERTRGRLGVKTDFPDLHDKAPEFSHNPSHFRIIRPIFPNYFVAEIGSFPCRGRATWKHYQNHFFQN